MCWKPFFKIPHVFWWSWLLLLLLKVVWYPWLRVYVLKSIILDSRLSVVCVHIFWFFVFERKNMLKKKQLVQDLIPPPSIYIKMWRCTHIRIYICRDLVHLDSLGPPGVSSRPLGSQPSTPSVQGVCVCVYTHIYTHTLPPAFKIEKTQTTLLSFLLSQITPHAKQQVPS